MLFRRRHDTLGVRSYCISGQRCTGEKDWRLDGYSYDAWWKSEGLMSYEPDNPFPVEPNNDNVSSPALAA